MEIIAVLIKITQTEIETVELVIIKADGAYSYHWSLKG
jgi:hypothetical protein